VTAVSDEPSQIDIEEASIRHSDKHLDNLFKRNRAWVNASKKRDPNYFKRLSGQQKPRYFWIGCCDSRVPATEIVDLAPGEMFVHRNIANLAVPTDPSFSAALQFAVEVLCVDHIMIVGHYGCGGIQSLLEDKTSDPIGDWLEPARHMHQSLDRGDRDDEEHLGFLCEQNVLRQVENLLANPCIRNAWQRGQELSLHGWVYAIEDGLLKSLVGPLSHNE